MTGPEHYQLAERLLSEAARDPRESAQAPIDVQHPSTPRSGDPSGPWQRDALLALAQVHATLALAAATALGDSDQWNAAAAG